MDLKAVRTFVAVADSGQFQEAAAVLAITQQAVSKRIGALEKELGVRLFTRTARGAELTVDGHAFLPHARELLLAEERAAASVRLGRRPLRVDVIGARLAPAGLLRGFHEAHPDIALDVVTLFDVDSALTALRSGAIDASFRAVVMPGRPLPRGVAAAPVYDEPLQLLTGPRHALAGRRSVSPGELAGHRIWMPGIVEGTEWAAYYACLAAEFGLTIDSSGPNFTGAVQEAVAGSGSLATLVSERTRLTWPSGHDLRRIPLRDPTPVYPHSLLWVTANPHPALPALRAHLTAGPPARPEGCTWTPAWAVRGVFPARRP
ncbi:LysR family transcriptional regulator [Streptomyces sp. NBC_00557]|uniref:LysR family transcriptional regulator n=1 Tax=Streptomyces sp. NBC_00557 TaxID=2975776 RepID=UPI002E818B53|nr:LysR family transcriptional regulator [Streptomyces sp. NBC_00557]WUC33408.1 LysR family transcriptional regulator [Streptomyces sp. NBC_00557]